MATKNYSLNTPIYGIEFEYQMAKELARGIMSASKQKISDPQRFLVDYVNRELGLRGHCIKVIVY